MGEQLDFNFDVPEEQWLEDPRFKSPQQMVREYQATSGQNPDDSTLLYLDLMDEEWNEWAEAWNQGNKPEELKELADMIYVIYGYAETRRWNLDEALIRVHENNMDRMYQPDGTIHRREDGKIIKNPTTPKVRLEDLV